MGLRFVAGPPGSGKTEWMLRAVRSEANREPEGPPLILLVPEQASYQTEQALIRTDLSGTVRARVLSFARLAQWVFSMTPGPALPRLGDIHRRVLVTAIIAQMRRENRAGRLLRVRSIDESVAAMLSEMKQFRVSTERLRDLANDVGTINDVLAEKLSELADVAEDYDRRIANRFQDPEQTLMELRRLIEASDELQGARVYVDGFHGFTPIELEVLAGLMKRAEEVNLALSIDLDRFQSVRNGDAPDEESRSFPTEETLEQLLALATDNQVQVCESIALDDAPRFQTDSLQKLQKALKAEPPHPPESDPPEWVRLVVAANGRDECRAAVEQLLEWKRDRAWHWGRMAILTRQLDSYVQPLSEYLHAAGIPFFIDRHEPLQNHPAIQGLLAALEAVLGGWRSGPILEFAKSGLFAFDRDAVSKLDEFVDAYPRRAEMWVSRKEWKPPPARSPFEEPDHVEEPKGIDELDALRREVVAPLQRLLVALSEAKNDAGEYCLAGFVQAACGLLAEAMPEPSETDEPILTEIGEVMQAMVESSADDAFEAEVCLELMRSTLGTLTLPRIPPRMNQVIVGQVDRTRLPEMQGAIVLGLAEGRFPLPGANATLLTDQERDELRTLEGKPVELKASSRRLYMRELFFAQLALTRASHALTLLRPFSDDAGQALMPSPYWSEVERLFPQCPIEHTVPELSPDRVLRAREAAAILCREIFETTDRDSVPPFFGAKEFVDGLPLREREGFLQVLCTAGLRNEARISSEMARQFLGDELRTSVSALESFANCPFQYFLNAMIRPEVAPDATLTRADVGSLAHAALKELTDKLIAESKSFADLEDDAIAAEVAQAFAAPVERMQQTGLYETAGGKAIVELVKRQVTDLVHFIVQAARAMSSRPIGTEVTFGPRGELDALRLEVHLDDGSELPVLLRGQIDRIDVAESGDGDKWLIVVDYKLGSRKQNWAAARDGKSLQLPVYLCALQANAKKLLDGEAAKLGGAVYLGIVQRDDTGRTYRGIVPATANATLWVDPNGMALVGRTPGDPAVKTAHYGDAISDPQFERLLIKAKETIGHHVKAIARGDVQVGPALQGTSTPCGWCPYRPACRLDYSMNSRRLVPNLKRSDAVESWLGPPEGGQP
ncbi:PD-(D/E)XK nuclease family protein [bacterium]|nr:PD-(D/E)XK nuclease family protein [bacterium]